ncbi:uncharacterized protein G2W53_001837 [Senna tora]|uniref:Uncharacterized protein n=1 Tax=Senna tora TaxID=362788 RepID=A0A834XH11_9FABA|nr:uncharacterized protein G2W53_001837 [Senna tora]
MELWNMEEGVEDLRMEEESKMMVCE